MKAAVQKILLVISIRLAELIIYDCCNQQLCSRIVTALKPDECKKINLEAIKPCKKQSLLL